MTAVKTSCPPEAVLSDFGLGKLDAASAETVSRHIDTCADCQQRVAGLPGDSFVGRLQKAGAAGTPLKRERTYVPGESMANSANSTDGSLEDGPASGSRKAPGRSMSGPHTKQDGLGSPSSISAPPELQNHPDYELIKELGQGGMGTVYLAKNRMMDRLEVLKVISKSLLDRPGALERFQQEIRSAARLAHTNIVAAYSVLRPGELLVFAMEYVRGQDLSEVVKQRGPLPVANAAFYIHQVANGLQHAFEKGMVHRDIKPNNLMLAIEGKKHVVKILDFGLAKATSEKGAETGLTKSGQMLGTPDYVAPEQTLDAHKADIRADIYSLGCTLYFLLSGGPPFQETSLFEILKAHHEREPKPLNLVRPEVPIELAAVVGKMMAKRPEDRYQTPIEVARALVPFFKPGQSMAAPPRSDVQTPQLAGQTVHGISGITPPPPIVPPSAPTPFPIAVPVAAAPAEAAAVMERVEPFSISIEKRLPPERRRGWWWRLLPWQQFAIAGGATASILLLGVILLVRTPKGTVEIELSDKTANVTVAVDGNHIDISGLDEPLSLKVGEHQLTVKGSGYETMTREFKVTSGKNAPLKIRLVPHEPSSVPERTNASSGFVSLFNGKDLTGWKTHPSQPGNWHVDENRVLIGPGVAKSHLYSERGNFTNFHLRAEVRINDGGNGGVYSRSQFGPTWPSNNPRWPDGYEAEITTTGSGILLGPYGKPVASGTTRSVRANEWFLFEVIATDNHIVVKIDGQTTADWSDPDRTFPRGHIALQQDNPSTAVAFRKIEIKEFQPGNEPASAVTPLRGQEVGTPRAERAPSNVRFACEIPLWARDLWSIDGDELVQKSCDRGGAHRPNMPTVSMFFGDRNWTDYDFAFDTKPVDGSDIRTYFRYQDDLNNHSYVTSDKYQIVDIFDGGKFGNRLTEGPFAANRDWRRVEVRVRGNTGTCFVNGQKVLREFNIERHDTGCVGFAIHNAASFRFRNIIVKDASGKILLEGLPDIDHAARTSFPGDAGLPVDRKILTPTKPTDLLGLASLPGDALIGNWRKTEQGIQSDSTSGAKLQLRCRPASEYDVQVTFSRIEGNEWMALALCHRDARFAWWLGTYQNRGCGIASVNGWFAASNSTKFGRDPMFENGRQYTALVKVRDDSISTYLDGVQVGQDLKTDFSNVSGGLDASVAPNLLAIYTASPFTIHRAEIIPIADEPPSAGAPNDSSEEPQDPAVKGSRQSLPTNDSAGEPAGTSTATRRRPAMPINLLKQLKPNQPGTVGEWRLEKGRLVFPQVVLPSLAIFDNAPEEYTLTAVVQCTSHVGALSFGIVVANSQALVTIDGQGRQSSALGMIDGREGKDNATRNPGTYLIDGTRNVIEITVRKNRVQVSCNHQQLIDWKGDPSSLSLPAGYAGRHGAKQLFITMGQPSPFVVTDLILKPQRPMADAKTTAKLERGKKTRSVAADFAAFSPGSVWKGKRTYRHGAYSPSSVTYELHIRERDGAKFKGHVFDNGPGRNRAEVEGEIDGKTLSWRERALHMANLMRMKGTLDGDTIKLTFSGTYPNGATNDGDGELTLVAE